MREVHVQTMWACQIPELQGERSINSPCAQEISPPAPAALPPRWDPPGSSAAGSRKVAGWRAPEAGVNAPASLFPLPLSPLVCC